ncbi:hypothetical protein ebA3775 [Aromatoleum aromaticum EbN1]|uniref:Uncharacterized protein n=1 Tax=Aromatoleum aromaticum (strain DSM 19018 / LMG 30748 / EbN1) TaxID=76114 RepID=Q5P362_AROAE|nr:hypothetical protein ebA3775 [Aromatoleum aromaticum EbN1]
MQVGIEQLPLLGAEAFFPTRLALAHLANHGFAEAQVLGFDAEPLRQHLQLVLSGDCFSLQPAGNGLVGHRTSPVTGIELLFQHGGARLVAGCPHCVGKSLGESDFFIHEQKVMFADGKCLLVCCIVNTTNCC